jgi:membrane protein DedA with SNARE-associated domain
LPDLSQLWIFWVSFIMLVAAGIGVPIPEELPVIGAGIWAANTPEVGPVRWLILPTCIVGIVISDVLLYGIGRFGSDRILRNRWVARLFPPKKREQIEHNFAHYGIKILLVVRWVPAIRSPLFITAGLMRVPLYRFIIADTIAASMGHTLLFFTAYWFGDTFRDLVVHAEQQVDRWRPILIITLLLGAAVFFLIHYLRRPVITADPKELPLIGKQVAAGIETLEHRTSILHLGKQHESKVRSQDSAVRSQEAEVRSLEVGAEDQKTEGKDRANANHEHAPRKEGAKARPPASEG